MWFLLKKILFISLILVVISTFSTKNPTKEAIDASEDLSSAIFAASGVFHYVSNICIEKPDICKKGVQAFFSLKERTLRGAKLAYELIDSKLGENKHKPVEVGSSSSDQLINININNNIPVPQQHP
ncbi:hypothetical protein B488_03900 [Liberibacter crescens BT-1]|uniref:Uncharacterized protein n=1 Tax=Liberibacter crescens (strain BT-1) TaxID=1215343 RepID=L0ETT9_LIBCB|nr:DUF5330 domain-containing protein [Liberibacter crescens]AGA64382.1 hypothetical protein B488_03900 [Liberibacter crescens BT-1]